MVVHLNQQEWQEKLEESLDAQIIDVRTAEEVAEGFIPGAIHIDIYGGPQFLEALELLDKTKSYFIYCRSGGNVVWSCKFVEKKSYLLFFQQFVLIFGMFPCTPQ